MPATVIFTPPFVDNETELVPLGFGSTRNEALIPRPPRSGDSVHQEAYPDINLDDNDDTPSERRSFLVSERTGTLQRINATRENIANYILIYGSYAWNWAGDTLFRCWIVLVISIFIEISGTTLIKIASDKSNVSLMFFAISLYIFSLLGFSLALKRIEVSVAYALWSGIGTAAVSLFGILMFGESCNFEKVMSLVMITIGVVGLNLQEDDEITVDGGQ